jgi:hypothetical protein
MHNNFVPQKKNNKKNRKKNRWFDLMILLTAVMCLSIILDIAS